LVLQFFHNLTFEAPNVDPKSDSSSILSDSYTAENNMIKKGKSIESCKYDSYSSVSFIRTGKLNSISNLEIIRNLETNPDCENIWKIKNATTVAGNTTVDKLHN
jgi:hypothetical protein